MLNFPRLLLRWPLILPSALALSQHQKTEELILWERLSEHYQISTKLLWDCLLALRFQPKRINGQLYFTASNVKRLDQFIKRVEIAWDCLKIF